MQIRPPEIVEGFDPLEQTLLLEGTVDMERLNATLTLIAGKTDGRCRHLTIDMSAVEYILVECLVALVSEISVRHSQDLSTTLRLPRAIKARSFLREWGFNNALKRITGINFSEMVDTQDHHFFRGNGGDGGMSGDAQYRRYKIYHWQDQVWKVPIETDRFFGFQTWDTNDFKLTSDPLRFKRAVLNESERWSHEPVLGEVLKSCLGKYYQYLPSHIVHEALSNAFRHGDANSVVAVSKADFDGGSNRSRFITLVFWDDGKPAYEVLKESLAKTGSVISTGYTEALAMSYDVKMGENRAHKSSNTVPSIGSPDADFLLATLYPGVTSDPDGTNHSAHPGIREMSGEAAALPGRGLSNLANAVIDIFGGTLAFRSGCYFMNVKGKKPSTKKANLSKDAPCYSVKIAQEIPFFGNMLTIRLPLKGVEVAGVQA